MDGWMNGLDELRLYISYACLYVSIHVSSIFPLSSLLSPLFFCGPFFARSLVVLVLAIAIAIANDGVLFAVSYPLCPVCCLALSPLLCSLYHLAVCIIHFCPFSGGFLGAFIIWVFFPLTCEVEMEMEIAWMDGRMEG